MSKAKKKLIFGLLSIVTIVLIIAIGGKEYMNNKEKENLANQRLAAIALKKKEPLVTKVVFNYDAGGRPGLGMPWMVGAEVTMDKEVFQMSLETDGNFSVNFDTHEEADKYDEIHNRKTKVIPSLEIIYNNGKYEVIQ